MSVRSSKSMPVVSKTGSKRANKYCGVVSKWIWILLLTTFALTLIALVFRRSRVSVRSDIGVWGIPTQFTKAPHRLNPKLYPSMSKLNGDRAIFVAEANWVNDQPICGVTMDTQKVGAYPKMQTLNAIPDGYFLHFGPCPPFVDFSKEPTSSKDERTKYLQKHSNGPWMHFRGFRVSDARRWLKHAFPDADVHVSTTFETEDEVPDTTLRIIASEPTEMGIVLFAFRQTLWTTLKMRWNALGI